MANDIPADLASALDERYALHGVLGRGGMATVYLADDRKHHRTVAIKVLRPEVASALGVERFLKEIEIVARLTHPHILAMYDSGEARPERSEGAPAGSDASRDRGEGFVYYVMPHIAGGSLRQRMERETLSVERALEIAAPVADALSYAHGMGVYHRDIKPENILFSQGHPVVADFGIAKAMSSASGRNLTRTGLALGTPGYMSPEQAAGFGELDARTDVYSLAVVIYEMIVGEIPGRWPTDDAVRAGRFLEASGTHRAKLAGAGNRIEGALVRAMAVQQAQRTASPSALLDDLRGVTAPRRRYGADEVNAIVKKASELEASNPTAGAMTIGGVEALAADVGIAPEFVKSAAQSLRTRPTPAALPLEMPKRNRFIGGPTRIVIERVIEGELAEGGFPVLLDEIRTVMRNVGQAGQVGRSLTWTLTRGGGGMRRDVEVLVSARGGRTRITVHEGLGQLMGATFGGIGGGMGGGGMGLVIGATVGAGHAALFPIAVPIWLGITFATARTTFAYNARGRQRELEALSDRLAALVTELLNEQKR